MLQSTGNTTKRETECSSLARFFRNTPITAQLTGISNYQNSTHSEVRGPLPSSWTGHYVRPHLPVHRKLCPMDTDYSLPLLPLFYTFLEAQPHCYRLKYGSKYCWDLLYIILRDLEVAEYESVFPEPASPSWPTRKCHLAVNRKAGRTQML